MRECEVLRRAYLNYREGEVGIVTYVGPNIKKNNKCFPVNEKRSRSCNVPIPALRAGSLI